MTIDTLDVAGIPFAIHAMRNPYSSWSRCDSGFDRNDNFFVGEADKTLSQALSDRGPEHDKHLRMIVCWADIAAPRYWWNQFDTYRHGVEKVSESTMHTIMRDPFDVTNFANGSYLKELGVIKTLNKLRDSYRNETENLEKGIIWEHLISLLPQSYLQSRTVMMSYKAIQTMYQQREGHKLGEWAYFRSWAETLPESWMITE